MSNPAVLRHWIQGPGILCHGLRIGFRATEAELLTEVPAAFSPGWQPCHDRHFDVVYSLEVNGRRRKFTAYTGDSHGGVSETSFDKLLQSLRSHLRHLIAEHATDRTFVHAAAVAWQGKVIVLPGRSRSGKSTLVRELIRAGAVYFSDEYAAFDDDGMVHPFAQPLMLRSGDGRIPYDPSEHGLQIGAAPAPAAFVVITRYAPQQKWKPVSVTPGAALLELADNTVSIRANPQKTLRILRNVVSNSRAVRSLRGEASDTVPVLLNTLYDV